MQVTDYKRDLEEMQNVTREEYLASLRRCADNPSECFLPHLIFSFVNDIYVPAERVAASRGEFQSTEGSPGSLVLCIQFHYDSIITGSV